MALKRCLILESKVLIRYLPSSGTATEESWYTHSIRVGKVSLCIRKMPSTTATDAAWGLTPEFSLSASGCIPVWIPELQWMGADMWKYSPCTLRRHESTWQSRLVSLGALSVSLSLGIQMWKHVHHGFPTACRPKLPSSGNQKLWDMWHTPIWYPNTCRQDMPKMHDIGRKWGGLHVSQPWHTHYVWLGPPSPKK